MIDSTRQIAVLFDFNTEAVIKIIWLSLAIALELEFIFRA